MPGRIIWEVLPSMAATQFIQFFTFAFSVSYDYTDNRYVKTWQGNLNSVNITKFIYATTSYLFLKDDEALKKHELIQKHGLQQDEIRKQVSM